MTELVGLPPTVSAIDCTGQVMKSRGWLVTLLLLANSEVIPGVCAVTLNLSGHKSGHRRAVVATASVATSELTDCQVNGPTLAVMSRPRLKAVA